MTQEDWTKMNKESHYNSLIKKDTANRQLIKKLQLEKEELKKQLILSGVGCSLPIKKEIVFSDSLKVEIETIDSNLKVLRAVNGWGYAIDKADIYINEK